VFDGLVDFACEKIRPDDGEVAHGGFGFFHEFGYVAFFVQLSYAEA
jgi:hypothetical protein